MTCPALCQASFAHNALDSVEGLSHCKKLTVLDLGHNRLTTELQHRPLALLTHLQHLTVLGNPVQLPRSVMRSMMPGAMLWGSAAHLGPGDACVLSCPHAPRCTSKMHLFSEHPKASTFVHMLDKALLHLWAVFAPVHLTSVR